MDIVKEDPEKLPETIAKLVSTTLLALDHSILPIPDSCPVYKHVDIKINMLMVKVEG